jgi:hypothetical protein
MLGMHRGREMVMTAPITTLPAPTPVHASEIGWAVEPYRGYVPACICGWKSSDPKPYFSHGGALRAYMREHSDHISARDHYILQEES